MKKDLIKEDVKGIPIERRPFYGEGLLEKEKRGVIIIYMLLNGPLLTQDLKKKVSRRLRKKITDQELGNRLKELEKLGIIKRKTVEKEGRGPDPKLVFIPLNYQTLAKLLEYIYSINENLITIYLKRHFIRSKYAETVIKMRLILTIQSKIENILQKEYGNIQFVFSREEKLIIFKILRNSHTALYYATKNNFEDLIRRSFSGITIHNDTSSSIDESLFEKIASNLKQRYIFNLQIHLGEDILKFGSMDPIEYNISLKFLQDKSSFLVHLSQEIEEDLVKNIIKTTPK